MGIIPMQLQGGGGGWPTRWVPFPWLFVDLPSDFWYDAKIIHDSRFQLRCENISFNANAIVCYYCPEHLVSFLHIRSGQVKHLNFHLIFPFQSLLGMLCWVLFGSSPELSLEWIYFRMIKFQCKVTWKIAFYFKLWSIIMIILIWSSFHKYFFFFSFF